MYPVRSGVGCVISVQKKVKKDNQTEFIVYNAIQPMKINNIPLPSLGMVRIGICVIEPFRPSILPARSYIVARSVYM